MEKAVQMCRVQFQGGPELLYGKVIFPRLLIKYPQIILDVKARNVRVQVYTIDKTIS